MSKQIITVNAGLAGFHKGEVFKVDAFGKEIPSTRRIAWDWQKNLVLDTGLDRIGDNDNYVNGCQVGSGNATPLVTDTALQMLVATTAGTVGDPARSTNASPPYGQIQYVYRFPMGAAAGNLAEIGITMSGSANLFSRSLIRDGGGNPTAITILPDEVLDVTYQLRWYAPTADMTGTCGVSGNDHDYIVRACTVTALVGGGGTGGYQNGWGAGGSLGYTRFGMATIRGVTWFAGNIGAITASPSTAITSIQGGVTTNPYSSGSYTRTYRINAGLTQANHVNGVRSISYAIGPTCWQLQLDPPVMKTANDQFAFDVRISWGRA